VVPVAEIVQQVREAAIPVSGYVDPVAALQAAMMNRAPEDIILVAGSLFLVAEIRDFLLSGVDSLAITVGE
jgi:dihydrofolate synthase/folylpolyglutamate synthase